MQKAELNAYILFKKDGGTLSYYEFQLDMIASLLFPSDLYVDPDVTRNEHVCRMTGRHFLEECPRSEHTGKILRKRCRVCYRRDKIRKDVSTQCADCPSQPGLCIACMNVYHTKLKYWM